MTDPSLHGIHTGDPGRDGEQLALQTLQGFADLNVRVVVIGGTAMRMLGSPITSIDLDCLIHHTDWERYEVYDFIDARTSTHENVYTDSYLDVDLLEDANPVWNSQAQYIPSKLFDRTGTRHLHGELAGQSIKIETPTLDALMFMKTKALGDRAAQLRYTEDPVARTSLMPDALEPIEGVPAAFFRRKAGKDLADISLLEQLGTSHETVAKLAEFFHCRQAISTGWDEVQDDLIHEATGLLARHQHPGNPAATLKRIRTALQSPK